MQRGSWCLVQMGHLRDGDTAWTQPREEHGEHLSHEGGWNSGAV